MRPVRRLRRWLRYNHHEVGIPLTVFLLVAGGAALVVLLLTKV